MTEELAAICAIRQLHARYVDAVWRRDTADFLGCFTADAEWKIAGRHMRGQPEIAAGFEVMTEPAERVLMLVGPPVLELTGERQAAGRTPITELIKLRDGRGVRTIGTYYERFVEQGGRWRIQWRHWNLYYYGPLDLSAEFYAPPEYGPPPGMPAADEPTTGRGA